MNLELNQIAPYLPYQLQCQYWGIINGKVLALEHKQFEKDGHPFDFSEEQKGFKTGYLKEIKVYKKYWKCYIGNYGRALKSFTNGWEFKPLLLPMSVLTKEIMERIYANVNAPAHMPDYCACETIGFNGKEFTHTFEGDVSYDGGYEFERTTQVLGNQYALINELFKMHFDYFGLIEKGLAIDKTTI